MFWKLLAALLLVALALFLLNTSWLASPPGSGGVKFVSHRGVHQTYNGTDPGRDDCTATRIDEPEHEFLENTIPSMKAAFEAGADIVEIDIHPTTDARFAVFHDWTVGCRTDGTGVTRDHSLSDLKQLDIGYGYTADGGKTFPFRGKGVGQIPSLSEVLEAFPGKSFLINFKSRDASEADRLTDLLNDTPDWKGLVWGVYGGEAPTWRMKELNPDLPAFTKGDTKACLIDYLSYGWSSVVPQSCHDTQIMVPSNYAWLLWGWPNRFLQRMAASNTVVFYTGATNGSGSSAGGIDTPGEIKTIPSGFNGYVWTNRIRDIGPLLKAKVPNPG